MRMTGYPPLKRFKRSTRKISKKHQPINNRKMKQTLFFVLLLVCFTATAQKQKKPNLNKALNAWRDGNLAEAKQIIDDATTYEKTKDDGKTWYYRGLIYASIDTTSNEEHKSLAENPLQVAVESFAKADQLGKAGSEYFVMTP